MAKRALITSGAGFVDSHLAKEFAGARLQRQNPRYSRLKCMARLQYDAELYQNPRRRANRISTGARESGICAQRQGEAAVALVSQAEVIRAALIYYYLGLPIDLMLHIAIDPARVTVVAIGENGPTIVCVNA